MASSCVPASSFESPRRELTIGDLEGLLRRHRVLGLAEMMNFPGVVSGSEHELAKLALARHVDGHAPGVRGRALNAYAAAGIRSDHEASTLEEGRERLRAGMWLLIREASAARNLRALVPLALEYGPSRIAFCTDDREPEHIADDGHINAIVRDAVALGVPPEDALVMASLNPALYHGLDHLGAIAPGYQADVLLLPDLESFVPELVLQAGRPVGEIPRVQVPDWVKRTVHVDPVAAERLPDPLAGGRARVIGLVPDQIVTAALVDEPAVEDGFAVADPARDLAKVAVLERHLGTGRIGLGFVRGFGLAARRVRRDALPRRAQRRRRRRRRRRDGARGRAAARARRRHRRRRGAGRPRGAAPAGGRTALRPPAGGGARVEPRAERGRRRSGSPSRRRSRCSRSSRCP